MKDAPDPTRWCDDPAGLPRELVDVMSRYASEGPSKEVRDAVRARLVQQVGPQPTPRLPRFAATRTALTLLAGLALGGGVTAWHMQRAAEPAGITAPAAPPTPPQASNEAIRMPAPGTTNSAPPAATLPPDAGAQAAMPTRRRPRATPRAREVASATYDSGVELELLRRARRVLATDPQRSLALTDEHAQRFGEGLFAQERELIAIEALVSDERGKDARMRAARFRARYPRSAHRERLRVLLGPP